MYSGIKAILREGFGGFCLHSDTDAEIVDREYNVTDTTRG